MSKINENKKVCGTCGSGNVAKAAFVNPNSNLPTPFPSHTVREWCYDCELPTVLLTPLMYSIEHRRKVREYHQEEYEAGMI